MRRIWMVFAVLCLLCTSCTPQAPLMQSFLALDTACSVKLYGGATEAHLRMAVSTVEEYERLWSRTVPQSDIARLNAAEGEAVALAEETSALLETASAWMQGTDGAFDITVAPYKELWETASAVPSEDVLREAGQRVGAEKLLSSPWRLADGASLDLGAIAKGAIADELCERLKADGCTGALIDLGGNITALGHKPDGSPFHVAIADPRDTSKTLLTVAAADVTLSTSGSYQRFYELEGRRYSHILDPETGHPVENDLLAVTVIAPCGADADALSTACFVMGFDKGKALIDSLDGIEAVFVKTDGAAVPTDGVPVC